MRIIKCIFLVWLPRILLKTKENLLQLHLNIRTTRHCVPVFTLSLIMTTTQMNYVLRIHICVIANLNCIKVTKRKFCNRETNSTWITILKVIFN